MEWGLGLDRPIDNVIRSLENAGVMVLLVEGYVAKVDAFSATGPTGRKLVVLNRKDSASRTTFNAAHELGHLVIHEGIETGDRETERQADRFASAYLMPRAGFVKEFPRTSRINWTALLKLKARWRVSLQAMVRRAYDLALISAVQYQRFYKAISAKGWRKAEPGEFHDLASALSVSSQKLSEITGINAPDGQPPDDPGKVVSFVAAKEARRRA